MALSWKGKSHTELENTTFASEKQRIGKYAIYEIQIEKKNLEQRSLDSFV